MEEPKINKWVDKLDQDLELKKKREVFEFEKLNQSAQEDPKLKEDQISKLEDFEIDHNKKN